MARPVKPKPFVKVRVRNLGVKPSVTALCVGYEKGDWRASQFARHIIEWLPEFALKHAELNDMNSGNAVEMIRDAAKRVYQSKKFEKRGEFGELFLHAAIREVFDSQPAISKLYYKSARNETVKGFDAVHVVESAGSLELWLGEAKFYSDIGRAVADVVKELKAHTDGNYLRDEFLLIRGKIDPSWPHAQALEDLLAENKSLDDVFARTCIAVLLTYDSPCLGVHSKCDAAYEAAFKTEVGKYHALFTSKALPPDVTVHLILLPLNTKKRLLTELDSKLRNWQMI
jgi:hypothetical protein